MNKFIISKLVLFLGLAFSLFLSTGKVSADVQMVEPEIRVDVRQDYLTSLALHLVNEKREEAGLPLVKLDKKLTLLSKKYAKTMKDTDTATHYIGGTDPRDRAIDFGIKLSKNFKKNNFTENIAYGLYSCLIGCRYTPESELRSRVDWFVSEKSYNGPHYRTIYHTDFNAVGIGMEFVKSSETKGKFFISWEYAMLDDIDSPSVFPDIEENHPNKTAIEFLSSNGIINGYEDGFFRPNKYISRAEALKIIFKALDISSDKKGEFAFKDVDKNSWYYPFVVTAINRNIVNGYDDGTFRPDRFVSRVESIKMLLNSSGYKLSTDVHVNFQDIQGDDWTSPYVAYVYKYKLMDFFSESFGRDEPMTRQEFSEMVYRFLR